MALGSGETKARVSLVSPMQGMVNWRLDFLSTSSSVNSLRDKV